MARGAGCVDGTRAVPRGGATSGAAATYDEVAAFYPDHPGTAWEFHNGGELRGGCAAPPREALEAALAASVGISEDVCASAYADRPWSELYIEAQGGEIGYDDRHLYQIAAHLEDKRRSYEQGRSSTWLSPRQLGTAASALIDPVAARQGPGARSGRLEDYTRMELCKLLGYLLREADGLSDEELRAMALDAGLVPPYRGAPSHVELAYRQTYSTHRSSRLALRAFRKALRTPYRKLLSGYAGDLGQRDPHTLIEELRTDHPWIAHALTCAGERKWVFRFAESCGIPTTVAETDRYLPDSEARFVSSLERRHGAILYARLAAIGGGKLNRIVGHASDGQWNRRDKRGSHTLAYYNSESGELHLSPHLDKIIRKAERGEASSIERYLAAVSLEHELGHASSGGDGSCNYVGEQGRVNEAEQTIEEGEVEILARLNVDTLGRQLGLCGEDESLRAEGRNQFLTYPFETETMIALYAAATGELDTDWLKEGGYREPEGLSDEARALVSDTHHGTNLFWRDRTLAELIAPRCGLSQDDVQMELHKILRLPRNLLFTAKMNPNTDKRRKDFSFYLADRLAKLMGGTLTA